MQQYFEGQDCDGLESQQGEHGHAHESDARVAIPTTRYWLREDGEVIQDSPGAWHQASARSYLRTAQIAINPKKETDKDIYGMMFKLGFMRILEEGSTLKADNDNLVPSPAQNQFLADKQVKGVTIVLNSREFQATRDGGENS